MRFAAYSGPAPDVLPASPLPRIAALESEASACWFCHKRSCECTDPPTCDVCDSGRPSRRIPDGKGGMLRVCAACGDGSLDWKPMADPRMAGPCGVEGQEK